MKNNDSIRLQVYLSHAGICSRRSAITWIEEGRVKVNRQVVTEPGRRVNITHDKVQVDGKPCTIHTDYVYYMLNKPRKVESTNTSTHNTGFEHPRRTVQNIISRYYDKHIYSVGRLDYHSSGLLLFTNDGVLCNYLLHPRYEVEKTYVLETKQPFPLKMLENWKEGITINKVVYTLYKYTIHTPTSVELILREGKNREIRTICEHYHIIIKRLHRIQFACLQIKTLPVGKARALTSSEIERLYRYARCKPPKRR